MSLLRTNIWFLAVSVIFLLFTSAASTQSLILPSKINVYCTSNQDGTGECYEIKTNILLKCTGVPGETVPCRIPGGDNYNCIFFSATLLACNLNPKKNVSQQSAKVDQANIFNNTLEEELGSPQSAPQLINGQYSMGNGSNVDDNEEKSPLVKKKEDVNNLKPILAPIW